MQIAFCRLPIKEILGIEEVWNLVEFVTVQQKDPY
jgi:hypothetical protein